MMVLIAGTQKADFTSSRVNTRLQFPKLIYLADASRTA